jgi:hypothetical protein
MQTLEQRADGFMLVVWIILRSGKACAYRGPEYLVTATFSELDQQRAASVSAAEPAQVSWSSWLQPNAEWGVVSSRRSPGVRRAPSRLGETIAGCAQAPSGLQTAITFSTRAILDRRSSRSGAFPVEESARVWASATSI